MDAVDEIACENSENGEVIPDANMEKEAADETKAEDKCESVVENVLTEGEEPSIQEQKPINGTSHVVIEQNQQEVVISITTAEEIQCTPDILEAEENLQEPVILEPPVAVEQQQTIPDVTITECKKVDQPNEVQESKISSLRPRKQISSEESDGGKRSSRRPAKKSALQNAIELKEKSFKGLNQEKTSPRPDRRHVRSKPPLLTPAKDIKTICLPGVMPPTLSAEDAMAKVTHTLENGNIIFHRSTSLDLANIKNVTNGFHSPKQAKKRRKVSKNKSEMEESSFDGESDFTGSTIDGEISRSSSPGPSILEAVYSRKRRVHEDDEHLKKSRESVVPSPSLADTNIKAAIPDSTAASAISLCFCHKKPGIFVSSTNNGELYCQALDSIDSRVVGCCNSIGTQEVALFRPSKSVSYQMLCTVHQQRLIRHNCCPGCGLFCTQGKYLECRSKHHYHMGCQLDNPDGLMCPHCGDETAVQIVITLRSQKNLIFLPQQKPPRLSKSAKMSITRGSTFTPLDNDDPPILLPSGILNLTDGQVDSHGVPEVLDKDKLASLLNIACRSITQLSKLHCIDQCQNSFRFTFKSLYNSARNGDVEKLLKSLACGLNPNHIYEDFGKQTALHVAAANGRLSVVHILLQAGCQLDVLDSSHLSPLTVAINSKQNDVVKYLIKCGASLILKGEDGMTPLHIAAKNGNMTACHYLLHSANQPHNYIDSMDDGGWTPLVWASEFNQMDVVRYLLSKGADPFIRDIEQNIALHWATFGGSVDIVDLYLSHGSPINAVNTHGDTPLHIAARQNKYNCVLLLLARGAQSDIKNKAGELAMHCAESPDSDVYRGICLNVEINALLTKFHEKTPKIMSNDISRGKERNQIQCVNSVDDTAEPKDYIYITENCFTSNIYIDRTITSLQSCSCEDNCNKGNCNCGTISIKCWYDPDGKLTADFNYTDPPMIFECNTACTCNRITCNNRVVQNGITCRFQLFRTNGRGWGVKTVNMIPKGTYVCEYIGEIISDCEADHREDDSYLFDLDNRDGETFCIDARKYGNIARFINHMCAPNLTPVHVFIDHQDLHFPRIAFFANRDIQSEEELGYDYGAKFWIIKWKSFTCTCTAEKCFYSEKMIKTTLDNYKKKLEEAG